ncbi:MATE family efflux transporter [Enterococcus bulliens]
MKKFIGDRAFYLHVLTIAVPIMIQNAITNFVGLLDNLMVGQIGTAQMSGVAIVNQLIFVFNLSIFGIVSAASIFGTQFYGKRDFVGMRDAFRFKLVGNALMCIVAILVLWYAQDYLISLYLHGNTEIQQLQLAHDSARDFLWIMLFTLPFLRSLKVMRVHCVKWGKPLYQCLPVVRLSLSIPR